MEKVRKRLQSWKSRYLSYAGRLQLLNSVINSILNFWLSAYRLPNGCITELEKICSRFLWSGPDLNTKKAKISWSEVCKKKSEGGLGLRRLKEVNKVLCLKLIWRILSAHSLWVDWIKEYLVQKGSFWSVIDKGTGSWIWRKLLKYRNVAKLFHSIEIGNGESTYFWYDNWSDMGRLWDITGSRGTIDLGIPKGRKISEIQDSRRRRHHRVMVLNQIEEKLSQVHLSSDPDIHYWKNSKGVAKNRFSTSETWESLRNHSPQISWWHYNKYEY